MNIFRSIHNLKLETIIGYTTLDGVRHSFLEHYGETGAREEE